MDIINGTDTRSRIILGFSPAEFDDLCEQLTANCFATGTAAKILRFRSCFTDEQPEARPAETPEQLHARFAHPGWEYATTTGPRKQWDDVDVPPTGDDCLPDPTWERNTAAGRDGWERWDYTEESYWRRLRPHPRPAEDQP